MLTAKLTVNDIREAFKQSLANQQFVTDKSGSKMLEILGVAYRVTEPVIFGTLNTDYAERELQWYDSMSLNVNDIPGNVPAVWKQVADKYGFINSNYGWCIYSEENFNQYEHAIKELKENPNSRRAQMIYTRPSMWKEYNKNGRSDFMCTTAVSAFIRENKLVYIISQRSCDVIYGYKNDMYWHMTVAQRMCKDLGIDSAIIVHQVGSLHIYERHFHLVK